MLPKTPSFSKTIKTEVVCPNDTNPMNILQGGILVQWMDIAAAVCAQTHAGNICVTVSIDKVHFSDSAKTGDILTICAKITRAFQTSMEIKVEVKGRSVFNPGNKLVCEAFFSFVAIDQEANKILIPPVFPETEEEKAIFEAAGIRRKTAMQQPDV